MRLVLDRSNFGFVLLALFLALSFAMGGSARDDALSLVLLRPLSVLAFGLAVTLLPREIWRENRTLLLLAAAMPILTLLHLLPLPPAIWQGLPGRELAWQIGEVAGIEQPWRPLSLAPFRTWNSFWSYFTPLAALLLALGLPREQSRQLVYFVAGVILVSGVIGLIQSIGGPGNGFYLYRVTNSDSAVGLFANRNHQAMLLAIAFPILAAAVSLAKGGREDVRPKLWLAVGVGVMVLPFLLVTGSRAGLVLGAVGIASALLVYKDPSEQLQARRRARPPYYLWGGVGIAAGALLLISTVLVRVSALQRLFEANAAEDLRLRVWGPITEMAWTYFPFGSGIGSFVEVYKVIEPDANLSARYLNHAHNDWLEMLLTGGIPALAILVAAALFLGRSFIGAFRKRASRSHSETVIARLGGAILLILALGSIYDYPLRVPSLASLFAVAVVWLVRRPRV